MILPLFYFRIIMYLPSDDPTERKEITERFKFQYCDMAREVGLPYNIVSHWGKLEMPTTGANFLKLRELMEGRYPLSKFNSARMFYDPKNLLGNDLINTAFGNPK
jgi:L-galactono-1,4-lactone dehydrogenase